MHAETERGRGGDAQEKDQEAGSSRRLDLPPHEQARDAPENQHDRHRVHDDAQNHLAFVFAGKPCATCRRVRNRLVESSSGGGASSAGMPLTVPVIACTSRPTIVSPSSMLNVRSGTLVTVTSPLGKPRSLEHDGHRRLHALVQRSVESRRVRYSSSQPVSPRRPSGRRRPRMELSLQPWVAGASATAPSRRHRPRRRGGRPRHRPP